MGMLVLMAVIMTIPMAIYWYREKTFHDRVSAKIDRQIVRLSRRVSGEHAPLDARVKR